MVKISTRGQYALLIMTGLAEEKPGTFIPLKVLSHRHNLSVKYLEQILILLSKKGLVEGVRGNNGGYRLSKNLSEYSVGEILNITEGELSFRGPKKGNVVSDTGNEFFWNEMDKKLNDYVFSVKLETLVEKNKENIGFEYYI